MKALISFIFFILLCFSVFADENYEGQKAFKNSKLDFGDLTSIAQQFPPINPHKISIYQLYLNVLILEPMSNYLLVENSEISARKAIAFHYLESFHSLIDDFTQINNYKILHTKSFGKRFNIVEEIKSGRTGLRLVKLNSKYAIVFLSTEAPETQRNLHTIPVDSVSYKYRPSDSVINGMHTQFSMQKVSAKPNEILITEHLSIDKSNPGIIPLRPHHIEMFKKHIQFMAPKSKQFYIEMDYIFNFNGRNYSLYSSSYEDLDVYESLLKAHIASTNKKQNKKKSFLNRICPLLFKK